MEDVIVHLIALGAVLFLARWLYRNLIAQKKRSACPTCDSCATPSEDHTQETPSTAASSANPPR